ncbi:MAG: accessory gene regulator B family protein [Solobacterium sp.]|nr:accessory gene regulator B family protein [Solobacterium sp.]
MSEHTCYSQKELALIRYGLEVVLLNGSEILCILIISLFLKKFAVTLIYTVFYSWLRIHCGGYHCKSKGSCFVSYVLFFLCFVLCADMELNMLLYLLYFVSVFYIAVNAPLQHVLNPLSASEIRNNRRLTWFILVLSGAAFTFIPKYRISVLFAVFFNAMMCFILKHSDDYLSEAD